MAKMRIVLHAAFSKGYSLMLKREDKIFGIHEISFGSIGR